MQALTNVTQLNLYGCKRLSCAGMSELIRLPLKSLALGQTRIRQDGMGHIAKLTQLTELHLVKEDLKSEGLGHLSALTGLQVLSLRDMRLSNQIVMSMLQKLSTVTNLKELSLFRNVEVGNDMLTNIAASPQLARLTALDLRETNVDGECCS